MLTNSGCVSSIVTEYCNSDPDNTPSGEVKFTGKGPEASFVMTILSFKLQMVPFCPVVQAASTVVVKGSNLGAVAVPFFTGPSTSKKIFANLGNLDETNCTGWPLRSIRKLEATL